MGKTEESCSIQLIDGNGTFNVAGIENFMKEVKLGECGLSYAIVSIMGPQSSGKSTLLNHLFHTNFREMDAFEGRYKTTKGIWMAKCAGIEPCTLVMDLEGTDGRERGEDDTAFEKQSALFALAVSDIVLINMWCHDIDREPAANKPLLKTVFQVMMRLFSPRKTTLMFVIRDKNRKPLEYLEHILRYDIQKIWDSVPKPQAHKETPISEFFNVEVVALSNYEYEEEQFKEQVASLRQRFFHSIAPGRLAGDRRAVVPASGFSFSAQQMWKIIKENKYLELPAHKVLVATVRCEEIANEKFSCFAKNEDWLQLEEAVQSGPIPGSGKKLSSLLHSFLSEYDAEAVYFDEGVRSAKRKQLEAKLLQAVGYNSIEAEDWEVATSGEDMSKLEALLLDKNRKMEHELTQLKVILSEKTSLLETAEGKIAELMAEVNEQQILIQKLEDDILKGSSSKGRKGSLFDDWDLSEAGATELSEETDPGPIFESKKKKMVKVALAFASPAAVRIAVGLAIPVCDGIVAPMMPVLMPVVTLPFSLAWNLLRELIKGKRE